MRSAERLLLVDWTGAALVGFATISLSDWLSALGGLPRSVLLGVGLANLVYGAFSLFLWRHSARSMGLVVALVMANLVWSVVCLSLLWTYWSIVTPIAVLHLGGEATYVGVLALLEWRFRASLVGNDRAAAPVLTARDNAQCPGKGRLD